MANIFQELLKRIVSICSISCINSTSFHHWLALSSASLFGLSFLVLEMPLLYMVLVNHLYTTSFHHDDGGPDRKRQCDTPGKSIVVKYATAYGWRHGHAQGPPSSRIAELASTESDLVSEI